MVVNNNNDKNCNLYPIKFIGNNIIRQNVNRYRIQPISISLTNEYSGSEKKDHLTLSSTHSITESVIDEHNNTINTIEEQSNNLNNNQNYDNPKNIIEHYTKKYNDNNNELLIPLRFNILPEFNELFISLINYHFRDNNNNNNNKLIKNDKLLLIRV